MDNKTWGNLGGSTGTERSLQALQHQQLSAPTSASVYPGASSSLAGHSSAHWQRVTYCGAVNGLANSESHLLSQHQHNQLGQQQQQQQQAPQLRYFQVSKPAQYSGQLASTATGSIQQHSQPHQHNFSGHYAVFAASSALASNNSTITERSSAWKREAATYSNYFANQFQSTDKSARASSLRTADEGQIHNPNQSSNRQHYSSLSPVYRPRYETPASGNFPIPSTVQVSLTTCFALCSSFDKSVIEAASLPASASLGDQVSLLPRFAIPASAKSSLPRFVNAFEAVPDMLRDIRPGNPTILARSNPTRFPVGREEFSYHAIKPRLTVRVENSLVARVENSRDKNWPELNFKSHRAVASTIDRSRIRGIAAKSEKSVWKKIASIEEIREQKNWIPTHRYQEKLQKSWFRTSRGSEKLKTYADAVQVTGRHRSSSTKLNRKFDEEQPFVDADRSTMNLRDSRRPTKMCPAFFHTSTPKTELRGVRKKREYRESCEEDNEHSSTSTASNGSYYGRSQTPESSSSLEAVNSQNWKDSSHERVSSSSSSVQEIDEDNSRQFEAEGRKARVPSSKRLCKMAEMFCFGQLENAAFFRAFDEYNRRRRRMSYTRKLEDGPEVDANSFRRAVEAAEAMRGEVTLLSSISLERRRELFGNDSPRFQGPENETAIMSPIRINGINGMEDQGAFKVLQKLRECADGTGAIYTNSWRPEELHFLRRCHQDKNI